MQDFHEVNERLRNSTDKANRYANLLMPINANIGWISYALVAILGAILGINGLAGVTIGNLAGARLGSIAFLSNLMREIGALFMIPYLSRHFNSYTCIAPAAATSEDTTLPMMIRYTNEETVVLSVLNGMICSTFVPVLISLCY